MSLRAVSAAPFCVLAAAAALVLALPGDGSGGAVKRVDLGQTPHPPAPACPANCRAIARVTGFQVRAENGQGEADALPFRVPFDGVMTSWSIRLAFPTDQQRAYFNRTWGRPAKARIAVLQRIPRTAPPRYRLIRQGPPRALTGYLGRTPRFRLRPPIPVTRGQVIALTVPTWAPALAIDIAKGNRWRGSRSQNRCLEPEHQRRGRPHQIRGSRRVYGCRYERARLLYSARIARR